MANQGYQTYNATAKSLAEDVEDMIYNISPIDNPIASMARTIRASGKLHEWNEDSLAAAASNAAEESSDAAFTNPGATTARSNNCQIMTKTAAISGTLEEVKKYGRQSEMAYQLAKRYSELANDEELAIAGAPGGTRQTSTAGAVGTARKMASLHAQITTLTDCTGILTNIALEGKLLAAHQACYTLGGNPNYLFIPVSHAINIAAFASTAMAGRTRDLLTGGNGRTIVNVIDLYISPFGELNVVLDRQISGGATAMFLLDFNYLATPILRATRDFPIAKVGDHERRMIVRESTLASLNFGAHAMLDNVPASATLT